MARAEGYRNAGHSNFDSSKNSARTMSDNVRKAAPLKNTSDPKQGPGTKAKTGK